MTLHLYNTFSRKVEPFVSLSPGQVGMYVCGPTVYNRAHLGNLRSVIVFDVLYRVLRQSYKVTYVRNITDIDDKIMDASLSKGVSIQSITESATRFFHEDLEFLGVLPPTVEPRATAHIPEMIRFINHLMETGMAYEVSGHVLFHIKSFKDYGSLSHICTEDMIAGARVEVSPFKKDPADFVLWKPSTEDQPGWKSPWGFGRPGWHIECSTMSLKHLGKTFDIHGGGQDLIFPHHENELAQSVGAHGQGTFARYWIHNGFLSVNGEKMSKSLGNFITMKELQHKARGETIRMAMLSTHYRQSMDFSETETLARAETALYRLYGALEGMIRLDCSPQQQLSLSPDSVVTEALHNDLNTPLAITRLHALATEINKMSTGDSRTELQNILRISASQLGLLQEDPTIWLQGSSRSEQGSFSPEEIEQWIQKRVKARHDKNFVEADRIRSLLIHQGIVLLDSSEGTTWRRHS